MPVPMAIARFVPADPGFTPFGLPWLRGLNVLHFALVGFVGVLWGTSDGFFQLAWNEAPTAEDFVSPLLRQSVRALIAFTPMLLLVTVADNASADAAATTRVALLAAATLLGAAIFMLVASPVACLLRADFSAPFCSPFVAAWAKVTHFARALIWGAAFTALLYFYKRERAAARALHDAQMRRLNTERQETEARLRSLQAQIEPHFLFNTLAHIERLYQVEPARGRAMLRNLVEYLDSALPLMRQPESTLGRELALARAYLNVQQIRMGERLRVELAVPDALLGARVPPLMLVTLVENAIKHGLGPRPQGGTVRIGASASNDRLEVEVSDDGVGLKIGAGTGRGLANTRARLATLFGSAGALDIDSGPQGGVRAVLGLPLQPAWEATP